MRRRRPQEGYDLFLTGEPAEPSLHLAARARPPFRRGRPLRDRAARRPGARRAARRALRPAVGVLRAAEPGLAGEDRIHARVRPLDDQQVPAIRDQAQLSAEPARVLERVGDRHLGVTRPPRARAPGSERRQGAPARRRGRAPATRRRRPCATGRRRAARAQAQAAAHAGSRAPQPPNTSRRRNAVADDPRGERGEPPAGLQQRGEGEHGLGAPRRRADPGRAEQHDPGRVTRVAQRVPDGDDAAERVARHGGRQRILPLGDRRGRAPRTARDSGAPGIAAEPPCPGRSGTSTRWRSASAGATATQLASRAAQPVDEHDAPARRRRRSSARPTPLTIARRSANPLNALASVTAAEYS